MMQRRAQLPAIHQERVRPFRQQKRCAGSRPASIAQYNGLVRLSDGGSRGLPDHENHLIPEHESQRMHLMLKSMQLMVRSTHPLAQASISGVCPLAVRWLMTLWKNSPVASRPLKPASVFSGSSDSLLCALSALMTAAMTGACPAAAARWSTLLLLPKRV